MRVYFSGGSPIPETMTENPDVMLSYYVDAKNGKKPNSRMKRILKLRKKARREKRNATPKHKS